jgi:hypothetical protein
MREEMIGDLERELSINIDVHQENGQIVLYRYMQPPHGDVCVRIELSITTSDEMIETMATALVLACQHVKRYLNGAGEP